VKRKYQFFALCIVFLVIAAGTGLSAQENASDKGRLSVFGGLGVSNARGDYPSEYDAKGEFSFYPGLRLRLDGTFTPDTFLIFDFGYLETGFVGYVQATDSYFWNSYGYLNLNSMFGTQVDMLYLAGGLYLGIGVGANSYREYTDEWITLDSNGDFGLVGELGFEPFPFLSLGVQARFGLKSIGSSVDIKNMAILGTFAIHFLRF